MSKPTNLLRINSAAIALYVFSTGAFGQCSSWLPGLLDNGALINGSDDPGFSVAPVKALTSWDPDGAGPLPSMLVAGGTFSNIQDVTANRIAFYNPISAVWQPLGSGVGIAYDVTKTNNQLIVAGNRIYQWYGVDWRLIGYPSLPNAPGCCGKAVAVFDGDLIAAGTFTQIDGVAVQNVARFDGLSWSPHAARSSAPPPRSR